jgi:hypothetical protein
VFPSEAGETCSLRRPRPVLPISARRRLAYHRSHAGLLSIVLVFLQRAPPARRPLQSPAPHPPFPSPCLPLLPRRHIHSLSRPGVRSFSRWSSRSLTDDPCFYHCPLHLSHPPHVLRAGTQRAKTHITPSPSHLSFRFLTFDLGPARPRTAPSGQLCATAAATCNCPYRRPVRIHRRVAPPRTRARLGTTRPLSPALLTRLTALQPSSVPRRQLSCCIPKRPAPSSRGPSSANLSATSPHTLSEKRPRF